MPPTLEINSAAPQDALGQQLIEENHGYKNRRGDSPVGFDEQDVSQSGRAGIAL